MFESFIGVNFWTALFVLLNTLAIFFVAKKFLFVPVKDMIDSRQKEIDDMYSKANAAQATAEAMEKEYAEKLSAAVQAGERIVKDAVARAQIHRPLALLRAQKMDEPHRVLREAAQGLVLIDAVAFELQAFPAHDRQYWPMTPMVTPV